MNSNPRLRLVKSAWCAPAFTLFTLLVTLHVGNLPASAQGAAMTIAGEKVKPFEFNGDVRDLPRVSSKAPPRVYPLLSLPRRAKSGAPAKELAPSAISVPLAPMPSPNQDFAGLNFSDFCGGAQCGGGWPPDTNGDVGPNHYIEAVNTAYAIYSKMGTLLASFTENQLWSSGGTNPCNGNSQGDPVVLYDQVADRWILTNFAFVFDMSGNPTSPFYECIAASKTNDPVSGGWWLRPARSTTIPSLESGPTASIWPPMSSTLLLTVPLLSGRRSRHLTAAICTAAPRSPGR